jgi:large subunit ribosomal protein L1
MAQTTVRKELRKRSKRYRKAVEGIEPQKKYSLKEAIALLKKAPATKFDQSVELSFQLGLDPKQTDQALRGSVNLPHGTGKAVRVICFVKGEEAREAERAGADVIGAEDLIEKVNGGWFDFDAVVAHPDMMREISKLGRVLGPKGLMPSPKAGTVTKNVGKAVSELKKGKIEIKNDKTSGVHVVCGKLSFPEEKLVENASAVIQSLLDLRPQSVKGEYVKNISISSSMGPGLKLETPERTSSEN